MRKKLLSLLCTVAMILSMVPTVAFAAEDTVALDLSLTAVEGSTKTERDLNQLRVGDTITAKVTLPAGTYSSAQIKLQFDKNAFAVTKVAAPFAPKYKVEENDDGDVVSTTDGWNNINTSSADTANAQGYVGTTAVGYVYDGTGKPGNITVDSRVILNVTLKVKNDATLGSTAPFKILNVSREDLSINHFVSNNEVAYSVTLPSAVSATVVQELGSVALNGSVTTPTKGGTDSSNLTGTNVTANVTWSPALTDGKFAANTPYTATVTVTPNTGYVFTDSSKVTLEDYNFTKSGNSFVATKTFGKTDDKSLTALAVTSQPTKKTYTHGDQFDQNGMVVKATYDDGSTDNNFTDYTVSYANGTYLKKGDTTVTLKAGDKTATVSGLTVGHKELSITGLQATDRAYNGNTEVVLTGGTLTDVVDRETVSVTMPTMGTVTRKDVGDNKVVTVTTPELTGTDADNYMLADISGVKVNITPAEYTYTYAKTEDTATVGTALPTSDAASATGVNSETVSGRLAWYTDAACTTATSGNFTATGTKTLYWKFTPDSSATNYVTTSKTGSVVYTVSALPTQDVTFAQSGAKTVTYGEADFTNAATNHTTNGGAISYASSNANVATVNDAGQVTIKGAGTTTITATAAEVSAQYAKTEVSYTLTVNKKTVGLTWDGADTRTYDGQPSNVTATATGLISGDEVNVSVTGGTERDAGTHTATATALTGERAENYTLPSAKMQSYIINKKNITVASVKLKEKTYDGTTTATVESVKFNFGSSTGSPSSGGSGGNQSPYTATAVYDSANASDTASATVQVTLVTGGRWDKNYNLTNGENFKTTGKINKAQTTLTVAAKDAVYTSVAYAETNLTKTSNVDTETTYTYYADNNGAKGEALETAPVSAGTYWVQGNIVETQNYSAVTSEAVKFQITKAPLTITAKPHTITYGDAVANDGVTYTGLVNSEVGTTVAPVGYEYSYKQYDNVGEYVITPKGDTADNYDITYQSGKLTVNKKTVGLTWNDTENLYYNGEAKNVTATATELVNSDNISVTVVGGKETAVGNYTAKATALTGEKAGNYALPTDVTKTYQIQAALDASALTVTPNTVTATIDGLTIKLVGYASTDVTVSATGATVEGDKLTINGVTYTIDKTGVKTIDSNKVTVAEQPEINISLPADVEANSPLKAVDNNATTASGLNNALADLIAKAGDTLPEGATKVEVQAILNIQALSYTDGTSLKLNIKPQIKYTYKNDSDSAVGEAKTVDVNNSDIKAPVSISVNLPSSFVPNFVKHGSEWLKVKTESGVATWQQSSFSEVELVKDDRSATVNFTFEDDHAQTITYGPADIGKAFPTDSKDGYTFNGWTIGDKTYTTLTEEALSELSSATDKNATASFTQKSNNGGNHGGSGGSGVSTYPVSVTTPKNGKVSVDPRNTAKGAAVTVTVTPDSGYEMDKLTVTDASGKTIPTTDKGNGKFTFTMPNGKVSVSATFKQTTVTPPSTGFVDVPASAYYADAVKWAVEKGITTGTSATTFSPEASCTRAQMVTFLWRAAGSPAPKATTTAFTDLDKSAYYYDAVLWAVEQGITTGTSATTFSPNATVTRGQTVTFLYRFAGQPAVSGSSSFTDVNSSDYYAAAVQWAKEQGITSGTSDTTFSPTSDCTRGQIVTFLYRQLAK